MKNKVDTFITEALDEMFKRVGFEGFDKEFTNQEEWYTKRSWTEAECEDFKKWFSARYAKVFRSNKKIGEKEFAWFNLMWGWKVNE